MAIQSKEATKFTKQANAAYLSMLPFDEKQDFQASRRGFIATMEGDGIKGADGHLIWDLSAYAYQTEEAPCSDTMNPQPLASGPAEQHPRFVEASGERVPGA